MKILRYILILSAALFLTASCSRVAKAKKEKLPPGVWDKEQMIEFLTQAQLVEAKAKSAKIPAKQQDSLAKIYYEELFAYFDTDKESWEYSLQYYKKNPEKLNEIYAGVQTELSLIETELQTTKENE